MMNPDVLLMLALIVGICIVASYYLDDRRP